MAQIATTPDQVGHTPNPFRLAVFPAAAVLVALLIAVALAAEAGALSMLMVQHLVAMNVVAPLLALVWRPADRSPLRRMWQAAAVQMVLLWAWHLPSLQAAASSSPALHVAASLALVLAATAFWRGVLGAAGASRWSAVGALLLTGKLACLLGALLIFARRDLYGLSGLPFAFCLSRPSSLADQQLAGLAMIVACPLSYLVAGAMLASRAIFELEHPPGEAAARPSCER